MGQGPTDDRTKTLRISHIISALDDRNLSRAMRLLEPAPECGELSSQADRSDAPRCVRCATHGE